MRRRRVPSWPELTLVGRFALVGGTVMLAAMLIVGSWITARLERGVIENTAAATALYMESMISPITQELAESSTLSEPALRALHEVLTGTPLGARIVSIKIWKEGGLVAYASEASIVGKTFTPSKELTRAWGGAVTASLEPLDEQEHAHEAGLGLPLLEIYSPVRQVWSGEIIAVAEFYAVEDLLVRNLAAARRQSWLVVAGVFALCGVSMFGIVRAGGRTISRQQAALRAEATRFQVIAEQNKTLRLRAVSASARAAADTERRLRQASADLHDGPAQYLGLAALRLDRILPDSDEGRREAGVIREALTTALAEIRTISLGLSLPDLERLTLVEAVGRVVELHERQTGRAVPVRWTGPSEPMFDTSVRICAFRFLQEALSNAHRHGGGRAGVTVKVSPDCVRVTVADAGPGFDPDARAGLRCNGGQGLAGLRDRAESLGGHIEIDSGPERGTALSLHLPAEKAPPHEHSHRRR